MATARASNHQRYLLPPSQISDSVPDTDELNRLKQTPIAVLNRLNHITDILTPGITYTRHGASTSFEQVA